MKPAAILCVALLAGSLFAQDKKEAKDADLYSFPAKITLDEKQQEKLAALRKQYEPEITRMEKYPTMKEDQDRAVRAVIRKKNLILTDEQRKSLDIKLVVPPFAQDAALNDVKMWDVTQLEQVFTIQSRAYDAEEDVIAFMVITKNKMTEPDRQMDQARWNSGKVQVRFYNKNDEEVFRLGVPSSNARLAGFSDRPRVTRVPTKLTDEQAKEGLVRYRIKIDLDVPSIKDKEVATVKFEYPEAK